MSRVFLDLDSTLIRTYDRGEAERRDITGIDVSRNLVVVPRPGLHDFLEALSECWKVCLLTAATQEYAEAITDACKIRRYFERIFSSYKGYPHMIPMSVNMRDKHWILVDDTGLDSPLTKFKFHCLGLTGEQNFKKHFVHSPSFHPHEDEDHHGLTDLFQAICHKMQPWKTH